MTLWLALAVASLAWWPMWVVIGTAILVMTCGCWREFALEGRGRRGSR